VDNFDWTVKLLVWVLSHQNIDALLLLGVGEVAHKVPMHARHQFAELCGKPLLAAFLGQRAGYV